MDCHFLLQEIFLNLGLLHCRQILYRLSPPGRLFERRLWHSQMTEQTLDGHPGAEPPPGLVPLLTLSLRFLICKMGELWGLPALGIKWKLFRWRASHSTWLWNENSCCCSPSWPSLFSAENFYVGIQISSRCLSQLELLSQVLQTEWLKQQIFISYDYRNPWSRCLVPGEIPLAGLLTAAFLLCQGHLSCVSFYKATHSIHKGSSLLT